MQHPPLGESFIVGYSAEDADYPIIGVRKDPSAAGYRVPTDAHVYPDTSKYPNHTFTGTQQTPQDNSVLWIYEILPAPWVPFTRYDDDLGPVQGRRRAVRNSGQVPSLTAIGRTTYEGRDGSAQVSLQIEENWSNGTSVPDPATNPPYPPNYYHRHDTEVGNVSGSTILVVRTGSEQASMTESGGTVTKITYDPFNAFLLKKVTETYAVPGSTLAGSNTTPEGQVVTITRQKKAAAGFAATTPTALRDVEVTRDSAVDLTEIVKTVPSVFDKARLSVEVPDTRPAWVKSLVKTTKTGSTVAGSTIPSSVSTLAAGEFAKTGQRATEFVVDLDAVSIGSTGLPVSRVLLDTTQVGQISSTTETYSSTSTGLPSVSATVDVALEENGDGTFTSRATSTDSVFDKARLSVEVPDTRPTWAKALARTTRTGSTVAGSTIPSTVSTLSAGEFAKTGQRTTEFVVDLDTVTIGSTGLPVSRILLDTTPSGQIASTTETYSSTSTGLPAVSATVDIALEQNGDGTFTSRASSTGSVFNKAAVSVSGASVPGIFAESSGSSTSTFESATLPTLTAGYGEQASARRETEFIASSTLERTNSTSTRETSTLVDDFGGGVAIRSLTNATSSSTIPVPTLKTLSIVQEPIPGGRLQVDSLALVNDPSTLHGRNYLQKYGFSIPFTRKWLSPSDASTDANSTADVDPQTAWRSKVEGADIAAAQVALDAYHTVSADLINIDFPDILESVKVHWACNGGAGSGADALFYTGSLTAIAAVGASVSVAGDLEISIKQVDGRNIPVAVHNFFVPNSTSTIPGLLAAKLPTVSTWPVWRPRTESLVLNGQRSQVDVDTYLGAANGTPLAARYTGGVTVETRNIPPTIHSTITIDVAMAPIPANISTMLTVNSSTILACEVEAQSIFTFFDWELVSTSTSTSTYQSTGSTVVDVGPAVVAVASLSKSTLGSTNLPNIASTGEYLYSATVQPFGYEYSEVRAVVVDFANLPV